MKVIYKHYEPNQGLEELQAKIFSKVSGQPASAKEIKAKYKDQKKDPKTILYALTEDGDPLAYVQATDSTSHKGRTHISYPWALAVCPLEIQEKIFDEVLAYLLKQEKILEVTAPLLINVKGFEERIKFFQNKGFSEKERLYYYSCDYDIREVSNWKITKEIHSLTCRLATLKDLEKLISLSKVDPNWQFLTKEVATNYFRNRILKDGISVLVFHENQLVCTGAVRRVQPGDTIISVNEECTFLRFSATRPGFHHAWKRMLIELAKECVSLGWDKNPLRIEFRFYTSSTVAVNLANLKPELEEFEIIFVYQSII